MSKFVYILVNEIEDGVTLDLLQFTMQARLQPECEMEIYITSPGGNPNCAFALYDLIRSIPNKVTTIAAGHASSAATIVYLAGDQKIIMPNAHIVLHTPILSMSHGHSSPLQDMELVHKNMKRVFNHVLQVFASRTGQSVHDLRALCRRNKHLSPKEAVQYGFAHEIGYLPKETP